MRSKAMGFRFEEYVQDLFEDLYYESPHNPSKHGHYKRSTPEEDKYEGVDFFIGQVRCDVTLNVDNKSSTEYLHRYRFPKFDLYVGVRSGTHTRVFEHPSLVLGFRFYGANGLGHMINQIESAVDRGLLDEALSYYPQLVTV